jgi:hypothetical protein
VGAVTVDGAKLQQMGILHPVGFHSAIDMLRIYFEPFRDNADAYGLQGSGM